MRKFIFLLVTVCALYLISCKNSDNNSKIVFSGVTKTDNFGTVQGSRDTTDWRLDDQWQDIEAKLFKESFSTGCTDSLKQRFRVMFYPNPARQKATLYVIKDSGIRFSYRLVDKDFNVIMSDDSFFGSTLSMNMSSFTSDDTIRIYYKFITSDRCEVRGHGDIFVMPYK